MALDRLTQITSSGISSTSTITVSAVAGVVTATTLTVTGDSTATNINASGIVTATSGFVGNVTGNVTGNLTGNVSSSGANTLGSLTVTNDATVGSAVTVNSSGLNVTGVITATSFVGDISQATGAAGLGSALSQTRGNPLNQIYYVNNSLNITETVTVNVPDIATLNSDGYRVAYTNYEEIIVDDTYDLIIADGDELQLDVLSLRGGF